MVGRQNVALKRTHKLKNVLMADWSKKSQVYFHAEQQPIVKARCKAFIPQKCLGYGICLCALPHVRLCQQRFVAYMKSLFYKRNKTPSHHRALLEEQRIFMGLRFRPQGSEPSGKPISVFTQFCFHVFISHTATSVAILPQAQQPASCVACSVFGI